MVVEGRCGPLGHLVAASGAGPSGAHFHSIGSRETGPTDNSGNLILYRAYPTEGVQSSGSGGGGRDISSLHHLMRKPQPDSVPWKRSRHNMSSEGQALTEKIIDPGSVNTNVSSAEYVEKKSLENTSKLAPSVSTQKLDPNQIAAKILRLRMKGKHEEADQLSRKMEAVLEDEDTSVPEPRHHKGRSSIRHVIKPIAAKRREGEEDADLQAANKIIHSKHYNVSRSIEDEYNFGDAPRRKSEGAYEEKRSTHGHILTQKDRCLYCFENPSRPKHLVVAIGNFTYLMLSQFEPVVPGHCVILPLQHESATRAIDSSVWEEIRNFKKCLLKMFAQQGKDVVFMETVICLAKQRRHCMIECIPVPREVSDKAPMFFKKAIDEAEEDWSQHEMKKLIPTSGNLRQVIPENFPYFHVEFGLDRGFVHVIDDESKFSAGFGLNVIRGMLRLPGEDTHRRRRHASSMDNNQRQAAASFMKDWEPFDWTKQLE